MINIKQIAGQRYSNSDDDLLLELLFENYYSMVRTSVARLPSSGLSIFPARPGTWCPRAALWTVLPPVTGTAFAHFLLSGGKTGFCWIWREKISLSYSSSYPRAVLWTVRPPVTGTAFAQFLLLGGNNWFLLNLAGKYKFLVSQGGAVDGPPARHRYGVRAFFIIWWRNRFLLNLVGKDKFVKHTASRIFLYCRRKLSFFSNFAWSKVFGTLCPPAWPWYVCEFLTVCRGKPVYINLAGKICFSH